VLTACDRGERAYEWDRVRHGVFAWHVLKAIDKDGWRDGRLTVYDIGRYVQERLREWKGPGRQTPQYSQSGGARGHLPGGAAQETGKGAGESA